MMKGGLGEEFMSRGLEGRKGVERSWLRRLGIWRGRGRWMSLVDSGENWIDDGES